jgi:hypothetical protein
MKRVIAVSDHKRSARNPFGGLDRHVIATGRRRGWIYEGIHPVPGRHVTDLQMRLYMTFRQTDGPAVAAAKASISIPTAYL